MIAPHQGYALIERYVQLPPVTGRHCATRMRGIFFRQIECCLQPFSDLPEELRLSTLKRINSFRTCCLSEKTINQH